MAAALGECGFVLKFWKAPPFGGNSGRCQGAWGSLRRVHHPKHVSCTPRSSPLKPDFPMEHKLQLSVSWQPVVSRISRRL